MCTHSRVVWLPFVLTKLHKHFTVPRYTLFVFSFSNESNSEINITDHNRKRTLRLHPLLFTSHIYLREPEVTSTRDWTWLHFLLRDITWLLTWLKFKFKFKFKFYQQLHVRHYETAKVNFYSTVSINEFKRSGAKARKDRSFNDNISAAHSTDVFCSKVEGKLAFHRVSQNIAWAGGIAWCLQIWHLGTRKRPYTTASLYLVIHLHTYTLTDI